MHADEITISIDLAQHLLVQVCPDLAGLSLCPVQSYGTDHTMFRLGADLALRFPRRPSAVLQVLKEQAHLRPVAAGLQILIPTCVRALNATELFSYPWSVCRWIEGETLSKSPELDEGAIMTQLSAFLLDLHKLPVGDVPFPGAHNFGRGVPLADRDTVTRQAIRQLDGEIDTKEVLRAWDRCLAAAPYTGPPTLIHGDLASGNVLIHGGSLAGVIDWGGLGIGDPACDLMIAWNYLEDPWRGLMRFAIGADLDHWLRGLGWALTVAALQLPYYRVTNPRLATSARATLTAIIAAKCYDWE